MQVHLESISLTWERFARLALSGPRLGSLWSEGVSCCVCGVSAQQVADVRQSGAWCCTSGHWCLSSPLSPVMKTPKKQELTGVLAQNSFPAEVSGLQWRSCRVSHPVDLFFLWEAPVSLPICQSLTPLLPIFFQGVCPGDGIVPRIVSHLRFVHMCVLPQWVLGSPDNGCPSPVGLVRS